MLEQFVTVLPGTLAPALLVMVFSVLLGIGEGRDRPRSSSWRLIGLGVGVLGALVFALLRATVIINRRTMVNYPTLVACVLTDLAAIAVVLAADRLVSDWHRHPWVMDLANALAALAIALTTFRALPDVILQLTAFVEPGEPVLTSAMLLRALGFLLGLAAAVTVAAILRTMHTSCPRIAFRLAALLMVVLLLVRHIVALVALMQTTGLVLLHGWAFRVMALGYNADLTLVLAQVLVFIIPVLACLVAGWRMPVTGASTAEDRSHRAFRRRALASAVWSLVAMIGVTLVLTVGTAQAHKVPVLSPPERYSLTADTATIRFSQVEDGHLHRFSYRAKDGTEMRFIIIRKNGAAYGVGLDACDNCGDAGYYEKDGKIICKKCDVAINLATIGFKGGCNPVPLPYKTGRGAILISTADLDALSSHFKS
ncbi:DUF2318 domain-containing protein [Bifidobacterium choladohabitans]|uniref:DUF2318 domain-containing protein n=1 Tax=Bifidobacterium choladohabitans TaxID=2750947 RepID=UPI0018DB9741|nr:DUF2318 domain-containing protein [Bifidobacterium choladohabitans]MBI0047864.1 DUF2318 domain-containing protein [Bifidobacterium choladohabitans]